jgi:8-oxo-(d)GTP phosphatase
MYKVFINRSIVQFIKGPEFNSDINNELNFEYTDSEALALIDLMLDSELFSRVNFFGEDVEGIFKQFCAHFSFIEAAGGLVLSDRNNVLMIFRNGYWDLPKGKCDKNEAIENCALREVEEECNVSGLSIAQPLTVTHHAYRMNDKIYLKRTDWFLMNCKEDNQQIRPQENERTTMAGFKSMEEAKELIVNSYPAIREVFGAMP